MNVTMLVHPRSGLQVVQVIKYPNKPKVARLYNPRDTVPNNVLTEIVPGSDEFLDTVTGDKFQNTKEGMKLVHA
jgi:hypothetical protein